MRRRDLLALAVLPPALAAAPAAPLLRRSFPRSGESIPAVGMGTWITFHVDPHDAGAMAQRQQVLERFFAAGGALIDSSPMYESAEQVLGLLLPEARRGARLFAATKVWTPLQAYGPTQMERSLRLWKLPRADLMQVHNLLNWRGHLKTLRAWKESGRARLIGVTTSHGLKHDEMLAVLQAEAPHLDAMQVSYSPADRSAEPLMQRAADLGLAVIANRPFDGGELPRRLQRVPLPGFAAEMGCASWPPLLLKWELAHPAVSCVIPATSRPAHMDENMAALRGPLPDRAQRDALSALFERVLG